MTKSWQPKRPRHSVPLQPAAGSLTAGSRKDQLSSKPDVSVNQPLPLPEQQQLVNLRQPLGICAALMGNRQRSQ